MTANDWIAMCIGIMLILCTLALFVSIVLDIRSLEWFRYLH